jgi:hypothetical protein
MRRLPEGLPAMDDSLPTRAAATASSVTAAAATASAVTAATAVATAVAATTSTAEAAGTGLAGTRFVDLERATAKVLIVHAVNGGSSFIVVGHGDECKPSRTAGVPVHHDCHILDFSKALEGAAKFVFAC